MTVHNDIRGVYTALITPFTRDGSIDWSAFDKLLQLQAEAQVAGVVISGTTGESPTLTVDEKISLFRRARTLLPHSIKVMAGTGGNCTKQSTELSRLAQDAGVDSLLVVTPPYNKPSRAGLRAHFEAIAESVKIPLCLYHVPGRTGQRLSAEDLSYLCEIKSIAAVKEASGDLALFSKASQLSPNVHYLSGDDFTFLPSLSLGGVGVISVVTNIFPKAFVKLKMLACAGNRTTALEIHRTLYEFTELLFVESSPSPTKAILSMLGHIENSLRLPMVGVQPETLSKIQKSYELTSEKLRGLEAF